MESRSVTRLTDGNLSTSTYSVGQEVGGDALQELGEGGETGGDALQEGVEEGGDELDSGRKAGGEEYLYYTCPYAS